MKLFTALTIPVVVSFCMMNFVFGQSQVEPEIEIALKIVIDYYNKTMNLAEKAELIEKYYELERDEGVFMAARIRLGPVKMMEIAEELDKIERNLQKQMENHQIIDIESLNAEIKKVQEELEHNYGLEDKNFRILATDPMTKNMRAVKRMTEHWGGLMHEFNEFTNIQEHFMHSVTTLRNVGIRLYSSEDPEFMIIKDDSNIDEFISKNGIKKTEDFVHVNFDDVLVKTRFIKKGAPKQTSQEIQALTDVMMGLEIDPVSKQLLTGFLPDMNKKLHFILEKMLSLETVVGVIETESQNYAGYIMHKRIELYEQLNRIQNQFPFRDREEL